MDLWRTFVLAGLKQAINYDYDRLALLANQLKILRQMMGHGDGDETTYNRQTIQDNVRALSSTLLDAANQLLVKLGHKKAGHKEGEKLVGRCDSKLVKTSVHYPTDVSLLWDTMRCLIRTCAASAKAFQLSGWRQHRYHSKKVYKAFSKVRTCSTGAIAKVSRRTCCCAVRLTPRPGNWEQRWPSWKRPW